eukprot:TRINITY_DN1909_c0_g1_i4.p1 TRINITY_DN1909_c0_g1~~TRINITY_DN1909_c0_g1_i4.p1  ORF type:complete len:414 (-),score=23.23 TRINITY_DN1909_c0_g1_i4:517-1758(-)
MDQSFLDLVSVHVADRQAQFLYASPSFHTLVGHSPKSLMGKSIFLFIHQDDCDRVRVALKGAVTLGECPETVFRFRCKDSTQVWLRVSTQLADEGKQFLMVACDLSLSAASKSIPVPFSGFKHTLANQISMAHCLRDSVAGPNGDPGNAVVTLQEMPQDKLVVSSISGHSQHILLTHKDMLEGRNVWDLIYCEDQPLFEFLIRQLLRGGCCTSQPTPIGESTAKQEVRLHWQGSLELHWVQVHLRQLHNNRGTLEMMCGQPSLVLPHQVQLTQRYFQAKDQAESLEQLWDSVVDYYGEVLHSGLHLQMLQDFPELEQQVCGPGAHLQPRLTSWIGSKRQCVPASSIPSMIHGTWASPAPHPPTPQIVSPHGSATTTTTTTPMVAATQLGGSRGPTAQTPNGCLAALPLAPAHP